MLLMPADGWGPIGFVPGETAGSCEVGKPETAETPGWVAAWVRPGGSELPTAFVEVGGVEGVRLSFADRPVRPEGVVLPGVPVTVVVLDPGAVPVGAAETDPVPVAVAVEPDVPVALAEPVPVEPPVALLPPAVPPEPDPLPPLWANSDPVQRATLMSKDFVFMAEKSKG
jgi:hypothetical protein